MSFDPALYSRADLLAIALGLALLCFGRRLYWLALGALGFVAGLWLAGQLMPATNPWHASGWELVPALVLGLAGTLVAIYAQRLAVALGGLLAGAGLGIGAVELLALASPMALAVGAVVGALVGVLLASRLFHGALIVVSAVLGAHLVSGSSHLGPRIEPWLFILLLACGVLIQARGRRPPREA